MKIGIIVHSHSGNTLSVAERLEESLIMEGYSATIERVEAINGEPNSKGEVKLKTSPDTGSYDVLVFGSPVWGFQISKVMSKYLSQLPSLEDKKVFCYVTHKFPFEFLGGTQSIKQMSNMCRLVKGEVINSSIVNWSSKNREDNILDIIDKFSVINRRNE